MFYVVVGFRLICALCLRNIFSWCWIVRLRSRSPLWPVDNVLRHSDAFVAIPAWTGSGRAQIRGLYAPSGVAIQPEVHIPAVQRLLVNVQRPDENHPKIGRWFAVATAAGCPAIVGTVLRFLVIHISLKFHSLSTTHIYIHIHTCSICNLCTPKAKALHYHRLPVHHY